jgi:hypothetical protein
MQFIAKVMADIYRTVTEPIRKMGREYGWLKFTAVFTATFITMGVIVTFILKMIPR